MRENERENERESVCDRERERNEEQMREQQQTSEPARPEPHRRIYARIEILQHAATRCNHAATHVCYAHHE